MCLNKNYCISVPYQNVGYDPIETINIIKNNNFNSVFLKWYDEDWPISQFKQAEYCIKQGINIEFAHLGYQNISEIWSTSSDGDSFVFRYCKDLDDLKKYGIKLAVLHTCGRKQKYELNNIGLNRFRKIVEYAKRLDIKIAFENTTFVNDISYVLDNLLIYDNVGFCFDVGHYHACFKDQFNIHKYKNRISCIHLHDNFSIDDDHLIPFDGNIDWNKIMVLLNDNNYIGPLTLEIMYTNHYKEKYSIEEFYKQAYESLKRLEALKKE